MNRKNMLLSAVGIATVTLGAVSIGLGKNSERTEERTEFSLRMVSSSEEADGTIVKIVSYKIIPENATDIRMKLTLAYEDGSSCAESVNATVDEFNKKIILKCRKPFGKRIRLTLMSASNESVRAEMMIDYEKRLDRLEFTDESFWGVGTDSAIHDFIAESVLKAYYTEFTKNSDFTFGVREVSVEYADTIDISYNWECNEDLEGRWNGLIPLLERHLSAMEGFPTAEEIWNCNDFYWWQNYLCEVMKGDYHTGHAGLEMSFNAVYYCNEKPEIQVEVTDFHFFLLLEEYNFEPFVTKMSRVEIVDGNLVF